MDDEATHASASALVTLLSGNTELVEGVAAQLATANANVELRVLTSVEEVRAHIESAHPDAVVVDLKGLPFSALSHLASSESFQYTPSLVIDDAPDAERRAELLALGFSAYVVGLPGQFKEIARNLQNIHRLGDASVRLQETEQHYRDILEASSDGIFVLVGSEFRYLNTTFASALSRSPEDLIGKTGLLEIVRDDDLQRVQEALAHVDLGTGVREVIELDLTTPDGATLRFEISLRSSIVEGNRAIVGVARDVTAERLLQDEVDRARGRAAQAERLRALGELAAGVAHDFNNALNAIMGRLGMVREKLKREMPIERDLDVIESAARNAIATARRIQEFSRPAHQERWTDVLLGDVVRDAASLIRTRVPSGVRLIVTTEPCPTVRGDANELREVVLNLLGNAVDAVGQAGEVAARVGSEDGHAVVIVEDDGHGMAPDVRDRIFEPFFSTKADTGTGLGLSVSRWILKRHDVQLDLVSEPEQGTRFKLLFSASLPVPQRVPRLHKDVLSILVVEDDETVADMMKDLLEDQGHDVAVVGNAKEAARTLGERDADLIITDLDLPGMSGWQLARRVRQIKPEILVGLMTGWALATPPEEVKARGVDFVLSKPFTLESLRAALAQVHEPGE